ncbi:MAG: hypothetical protein U5M51_15520 [Emticicia sp.]|nr:hypothetical protein [Emticicia sp.]
MKKKTTTTGNPIAVAKIKEYAGNFKKQIDAGVSLKEAFTDSKGLIREAEFFGKDKLMALLNPKKIGKEILGVRIYYGICPEDAENNIAEKGTMNPRLFLVPVDLDGNDMKFDLSALKDAPDGDGLGEGYPQPPYND